MPDVAAHQQANGGGTPFGHFDKQRADRVGTVDLELFLRKRAEVRVWGGTPFTNGGFKYTIMQDPTDPHAGVKRISVHRAVEMVIKAGFKLPRETVFYLTHAVNVQNQAFHFNLAKEPVMWVNLGYGAIIGGSGTGVSASDTPGFNDKVLKITLHEIGHSLHAHNVGFTRFYADDRLRERRPEIGKQISGYATNNIAKEIVAEMFLGMMVGREYGGDCLQYYALRGGPRVLQGSGQAGFGIL